MIKALAGGVVLGVLLAASAAKSAARGAHEPATDPWQASEVIQPQELVKELAKPGSAAPMMFQVGFKMLYGGGHIPGAKYAGPCAEPEGVDALKAAVKDVAPEREVVIYCGCCPWNDCPNIRPAYAALKAAGLRKIRVLALPDNFRRDWTGKGLPIEKGEVPPTAE